MKYLKVRFTTVPNTETIKDTLSAFIADIGFDSCIYTEKGIDAYVPQKAFDKDALNSILSDFPIEASNISYEIEEIEDKDWNKEWEEHYFAPIVIGERCVVHSTFHKNYPAAEYEIVINPQMAFGTGHHNTTSLVIEELLRMDLKDKKVLDMGCGTSILAILASMKGATDVLAVDIDSWCVENSKDNFSLNHITNIEVKEGDVSVLPSSPTFDVVLANINRNILLADMPAYAQCMKQGAHIVMSGFYEEDIPLLKEKADECGLQFGHAHSKERWAEIALHKK